MENNFLYIFFTQFVHYLYFHFLFVILLDMPITLSSNQAYLPSTPLSFPLDSLFHHYNLLVLYPSLIPPTSLLFFSTLPSHLRTLFPLSEVLFQQLTFF